MKILPIASAPRLGFLSHWRCQERAFFELGLRPERYDGPGWEIGVDFLMERAIKQGFDYALAVDYDTIFEPFHVECLMEIAEAHPEVDALVPVQIKRGQDEPLFRVLDENGHIRWRMDIEEFEGDITKIDTGHFGLTLIKCATLATLPKPWLWSQPAEDGSWSDGKTWADIYFWEKVRKAGWGVYLANQVRLGHLQEVITWPTRDFEVINQYPNEFFRDGTPEACK